MTGETQRSDRSRAAALRRYPALVWLIAAGLLALLLPSGLTLPQSGPPTLAEYAPVPGAGAGQGDLAEVGLASSRGPGAGSGARGAAAARPADNDERAPGAGKVVRKAGTKRCVGEPPRQTEDPLSPPCIAFFEGDNGGPTAKGVTEDEVVVTAVMEETTTDQYKDQTFDCADAPEPDEPFQDTLCKAYMRFFNDRYQTYGRVVHLRSLHYSNASTIDERFKPFAHVSAGVSNSFSKRQIIAAGYIGQPRASYADAAPYLITFRPDYEDAAKLSASFVCQRLSGRPARFAGDPTLQTRTRSFGYWAGSSPPSTYDNLLLSELRSQCNIRPEVVNSLDQTAAARFKAANVTSVILSMGNTSHVIVAQQANSAAFRPEWILPALNDLRSISTNFYGRLAEQSQWTSALGITLDYRRGGFADQMWYRAYREGCPDCAEPRLGQQGVTNAAAIYDAFTMLFYGIQSAGPRLTAENVDRGLHAIPPRASTDPSLPAAYFSPGNWSFIKDAAAIWWDPAGIAPGASAAGCYRLPGGGRRYRAGEWPRGDDDLRSPGPCQGDTFPGG